MEREGFFSGYCRCIDQSRMVAAEAQGNALTEVDCNYESCPYTGSCTVAEKIREFLNCGTR